MTLVVETGAVVAGANSFVTVAQARLFASVRGSLLPATEGACEALLIRAMDYLSGLEPQFQGFRSSSTQVLSFPRVGFWLNDYLVASNLVPQVAKDAQVALAIELNAGEDLDNRTPRKVTIEETVVGAVSVKYAAPNGFETSNSRASDALLRQLTGGSSAGQARVVRA